MLHAQDTTPRQSATCAASPSTGDRAPLFNNNMQPIFNNYSSFFYQDDVFRHTAPCANIVVNDDTKWLHVLQGMSARLNSLEAAIGGGNARIVHLDTQITALTKSLLKAEEFQQSMNNLTQNLKEFMVVLVTKVFSNQGNDLEMNREV
ncbi:hypothetical protein V8C37DRAFT_413609 [Trichoderma ceciliae]